MRRHCQGRERSIGLTSPHLHVLSVSNQFKSEHFQSGNHAAFWGIPGKFIGISRHLPARLVMRWAVSTRGVRPSNSLPKAAHYPSSASRRPNRKILYRGETPMRWPDDAYRVTT